MIAAWRWRLPLSLSEIFGVVVGLLSMALAIRQNIWNFPTGMAYNIVYFIIFLHARLYGMMGLQVIYFGLQAHGWYCWKRGIHNVPARVSHVPRKEAKVLLLLGILATIGLARYLWHVGGVMVVPDAFTTVFSLLAQYMLNLKRIENWAVGVCIDLVFIYVYISQGLYLTAGSFVVYLIVCIIGYVQWRRELQMLSIPTAAILEERPLVEMQDR